MAASRRSAAMAAQPNRSDNRGFSMTVDGFDVAKAFAGFLQGAPSDEALWLELDQTMQALFGHRLFTVLVFDAQQRLLKRVYSNSPEVSPVGGAKRVGDSPWARQTLLEGRFHVGSTRADLKSVFSEYERLWAHGCESVLNVPVRADGVTIATLNLLGKAHQYDGCDLVLARLFAQLLAQPLARILRQEAFDAPPAGVLDTV